MPEVTIRRNVKESIYDYKGFKIKIACSDSRGEWFKIFRVDGSKWYTVRQVSYMYSVMIDLLNEAMIYIDKFPEKLEAKYLKHIKISQNKFKYHV